MFQNRTRSAFSFIELVIVVVILGILAAFAIPQFISKPDGRVQVNSISGPESPVTDELLVIKVTKLTADHRLKDGMYRVVSNSQDKIVLQSTSLDQRAFDLPMIQLEQTASKIMFYGLKHPDYKSKMQEYQNEIAKHTGGPNP